MAHTSSAAETAEAREVLGGDLRDRVLGRLGFTAPPPATVDGLTTLYSVWGRSVPFDNPQKRLALATGLAAPLPCATPEEFFARYLAHGTGATCWPSSVALHALLRACGFHATRLAGMMVPSGVGHGSVLVRIADQDLLVDTVIGDSPLPLPGAGTAAGVEVAGGRVEPHGPLWRIWYLHPAREEQCSFDVKERDVPFPRVLAGYEASRTNSRFNTRLFALKNVAGGAVCVTRGARHFRNAGGLSRRELAPGELEHLLVQEFGYSEEIVARLPPDEPEP